MNQPRYRVVNWDKQPLGQESDVDLARRLGVPRWHVMNARQARGITSWREKNEKKGAVEAALKRKPQPRDAAVAREFGVSREYVRQIRNALGLDRVLKTR